MDAKTLNRLRARLPEAHLSRRLIRQTEHVAMRFDVRAFKLFRFYWENFDLMPQALGVILRVTMLMDRASRNAVRYRLLEMDVPIAGLPRAFEGYRILHLSDLHIDAILDGGDRLCEIVGGLDFDLCIMTGDYRFDTYGVYDTMLERMARLVGALRPPDGVVGILGNHDFIEMVPELEDMGITMLLNESLAVERGEDRIWLVGLDDAHYYEVDDLARAIASVNEHESTLLLVHSPEVIEQAAAFGVALYLCGHTHGGQVCLPGGAPVIGNARCPRDKLSGRWRHGPMQGYTHRGTGSSGLAVRINCPPEIAVHRLVQGIASDDGLQ
jgi:predicted MPP superfamily phosphohydrolase